jgi:hypothetical protein
MRVGRSPLHSSRPARRGPHALSTSRPARAHGLSTRLSTPDSAAGRRNHDDGASPWSGQRRWSIAVVRNPSPGQPEPGHAHQKHHPPHDPGSPSRRAAPMPQGCGSLRVSSPVAGPVMLTVPPVRLIWPRQRRHGIGMVRRRRDGDAGRELQADRWLRPGAGRQAGAAARGTVSAKGTVSARQGLPPGRGTLVAYRWARRGRGWQWGQV